MSDINDFLGCFLNGTVPSVTGIENIGFTAIRGSNQTIPPTVETVIDYTIKSDESPIGCFNLTTNRFTAPKAGRYSFTAAAQLATAAAGSCYLRFYKGSTFMGEQSVYSDVANTISPSFAIILWLEQNVTCEMRIMQNTGFTATLLGCCNQVFFSGAAIYVS